MNWKDEIDRNHKGQTGFFKEIENEQKNEKMENQIEKMTKKELMNFVLRLDPIKYQKINWFKGATVVGLRVQINNWYNREHKKK